MILKEIWKDKLNLIYNRFFIIPILMVMIVFLMSAQESSLNSTITQKVTTDEEGINLNEYNYGSEFLWFSEGISSHYGRKFHLRKTASGEKYHKDEFSAAHRKLPFGTILRVVNTSNNKSVLVRINDRGPFIRKRIIDLSYRSASLIESLGLSNVRIEGFVPGRFDFPDELKDYFIAYSYDAEPAVLQPELFSIVDSSDNFNFMANGYEELYRQNSDFQNKMFILINISDYSNPEADKKFYLGFVKDFKPKIVPFKVAERKLP